MHLFMCYGFIACQSMNIEQTYSMCRAQLLKYHADDGMLGCLWIIDNKANDHRPALSLCACISQSCTRNYYAPFLHGSLVVDRKSTRLNSSHSQISYAV